MHIIFGDEQANQLKEKYTVLELDTFRFEHLDNEITAYCTVETVPLEEIGLLEFLKNYHQDLINNYRNKNWAQCIEIIQHLRGKWCGELDTFYNDLESRIRINILNPPPADWTPVIQK